MNLSDIMQAAQGGQGVNNLASQFGLSPEQTRAAIQAMMPAFSGALQGAAQDPAGLSGLVSHLTSGAHAASFTDPAQASAATNLGGNVLGQIFGSPQVTAQVSQQVSKISGVDPKIIQQMMPIVASILMGGLMHSMNSQGLGGWLQLASAFTTPGGPAPADAPTPAGATQTPAGGLFGGLLSSVMGAFTGASAGAATQSAAMQAGLNTLNSMLQAGVQISRTHQDGLNSILQSISKATQKS